MKRVTFSNTITRTGTDIRLHRNERRDHHELEAAALDRRPRAVLRMMKLGHGRS
jgi:hypothetical protein